MLAGKVNETTGEAGRINSGSRFLLETENQVDSQVNAYLAKLSPDTPWGHRQIAAQELGSIGSRKALPGLLSALLSDSFWIVRCEIIQALERIGDPGAIPTLREVAKSDRFSTVRSYAQRAIERIASES